MKKSCRNIENSVTTEITKELKKSYRDIIKVCCDRIQERAQKSGCDRKTQAAIEANDKDLKLGRNRTFYVVTE